MVELPVIVAVLDVAGAVDDGVVEVTGAGGADGLVALAFVELVGALETDAEVVEPYPTIALALAVMAELDCETLELAPAISAGPGMT